MTAPKYDIIQTNYKNPDASSDMSLDVIVVPNTPEEQLIENIKENSVYCEKWLRLRPEHGIPAVLVGGGASINDCVEEIRDLHKRGATIISMNGTAKWLREHNIAPDWQVIVDAKKDTSLFVDDECECFFASQCDPDTIRKAKNLTLVHFGLEEIEQFLPEERVRKGGYTLLGYGSTVGFASISIAYSQGYREFHIFGYDSSYRNGNSHAFHQEQNLSMMTTEMEWQGKTYQLSVAMKGQAEKFPLNALDLKNAGCKVHVYGEGLLQAIYNTKYEDLTEKEKYQLMWHVPAYRVYAPGEHLVDKFLEIAKPDGLILDFGCGTGRAGVKMVESGKDVTLIDFADNCRDEEALFIPFIQADLTKKIPINGQYGFCTDVMEHIQTTDVVSAIKNIMESGRNVFFQICTVDDAFGKLFGVTLHWTVKPHDWWKRKFESLGYHVSWDEEQDSNSLFYIQTGENSVNQ